MGPAHNIWFFSTLRFMIYLENEDDIKNIFTANLKNTKKRLNVKNIKGLNWVFILKLDTTLFYIFAFGTEVESDY